MKSVGIIINPASGKDIRRLIASGSNVDNGEKFQIVKRVLLALDAMRVKEVYLMPDSENLAATLVRQVKCEFTSTKLLDMQCYGSAGDSRMAASLLDEMGVACALCLGGDGTSRVVAMGAGQTPLLPISTGTNNVFPLVIEGTIAGLAAAVVAISGLSIEESCTRAPRLDLHEGSSFISTCLVDIAIVDEPMGIASRAVWDTEKIQEVFLTRASPLSIGLSAIGGFIRPLSSHTAMGLHVTIDPRGKPVRVPLAPGFVKTIRIGTVQAMQPNQAISVTRGDSLVAAFDGEREHVLDPGRESTVLFNQDGPWVVDVPRVMERATEAGLWGAGVVG